VTGYRDWLTRHLTAFGLNTEAAVRAGLEWELVLDAIQCDPAELQAATAAMLADAAPMQGFFTNPLDAHRAKLLSTIRTRRAIDLDAPTDDRPTCPRCAGSGRLIVPHLAAVRSGHWVGARTGAAAAHYTQAVRCPCERGRAGRFTARNGASLMDLQEYEVRNPNWQRQLNQRQRELVAEAAQGKADAYDAALERIRARVNGRADG
jgi:hypothetical protein